MFAGRRKVVNHVAGQKEIDDEIRNLAAEIKGLKNTVKRIIEEGNKNIITANSNKTK